MNFLSLCFAMSFVSAAFAGQPAAFSQNLGQSIQTSAPASMGAAGGIQGKVLETMDAGQYTYVRLATSTGETWAAVPKTVVKVGSAIGIENPMTMDGFESKTLKRKFPKIVFGTLAGEGRAAPAEMGAGKSAGFMPTGMAKMSGAMGANPHGAKQSGPVDLKAVQVEKAAGPDAKTVEEVYAQKAKLAGQKVTVRGKVVKINMNIMNKNWIHLRDGSGSEAAGNFDLIVTSKEVAKAGDVIEVKGTVAIDQDLGAGYKYSVLIEGASLSRR